MKKAVKKSKKTTKKVKKAVKKDTSVSPENPEDHKYYLEQVDLIMLKRENDLLKHQHRMKELEYQRVSDKVHHDLEMERQRIRSAEIKKSIERKAAMRSGGYNSNYSNYQP